MTGTPACKLDGSGLLSNPSGYSASINNRLEEPTIASISVDAIGDEYGGIVYLDLTLEEAAEDSPIRVWSLIMEDHEIGDSSWGYFENQEMMWIPIASVFESTGHELSFSGPYPQTISLSGEYILDPNEHPFENLYAVTFIAYVGESKEVLNASIDPLQHTGMHGDTGIEHSMLLIPSNPSYRSTIECFNYLPDGVTATLSAYDLEGRVICEQEAETTTSFRVDEPGVYLISLTSSSGDVICKKVTLLR